jgi:hypothetical protein
MDGFTPRVYFFFVHPFQGDSLSGIINLAQQQGSRTALL